MKQLKRILCLILTMCMILGMTPLSAKEVKAATSLPDEIYLTQNVSGTCTLCSAAMMLRARTYLSNNSSWNSITENGIRSTAWMEGVGLIWDWTYKINNCSIRVSHASVSGISVNSLKNILDCHPEGIVLHVGSLPHAVFLTDYDGDTFYCADTVSGYSQERIPLSSSWLGKKLGSQSSILSKVTAYWYVSSYSIPANMDPSNETLFTDIYTSDYYYDAIVWASKNDIANGISTTEFGPGNGCTRGQAVTFLWRAAGEPGHTVQNPFTDITSEDYYYDAVLWAVEKGITDGVSSTEFAPDESCTRGQVVTFLWRNAGQPSCSAANPFTDVKEGDYYYTSVLWAVENGITDGVSSTQFAPDQACTRGQVVTFLYRQFN